jgi:N-acetylmuramoyl-L-alanine amidase
MKPVLAILAGHHGTGTGASFEDRDEWTLAREDALALFDELLRDGIVTPVLEPVEQDNDIHEKAPITRAARWAIAQKADAVIELHYNSFFTTNCSGHTVKANKLTPFVDCMARALDALPNRRRDTEINAGMILCNELGATPSVLIEPAFIFEPIVETVEWRPMLVAALKQGLYKYFENMPGKADRQKGR